MRGGGVLGGSVPFQTGVRPTMEPLTARSAVCTVTDCTTRRGNVNKERRAATERVSIHHAEPHVQPALKRKAAAPMTRKRKSNMRPKSDGWVSECASKEQVDALEKMLLVAMPSRVVLDNSFAGLKCAIAEDLELQYMKGVEAGQDLAATFMHSSTERILDLEHELQTLKTPQSSWTYTDWHNGAAPPDSPLLQPLLNSWDPPSSSDFAEVLREDRFMSDDELTLDLEELSREINAITDLEACK